MKDLFQPVKLNNGVTLKNRIVMAPRTTWSSNDDYTVDDQELTYYGTRNRGMGMVITGSLNVAPNGVGFTNQFAGYDDKFLPGLKKLAATIKENGAKAVVQINHAGNKALPKIIGEENIVSASAVSTPKTMFVDSVTPRELTEDEIWEIIDRYGQATRRVIEAGFDGVEIHGAHGFLIQNFMSPHFNHRTDKWGGSLSNRMRFALEVLKKVQEVAREYADGSFIIGWRISPDEPNFEDGLRIADSKALIDKLIEAGVTYVHASLSVASKATPIDNQNTTYVEDIASITQERVPLLVAGTIETGAEAQKVLDLGADLVAVGHGFVTDPDWVEKVRNGQDDKIEHAIYRDDMKKLNLSDKLWTFLQNSDDWFDIR